jgi:hypothetical protein
LFCRLAIIRVTLAGGSIDSVRLQLPDESPVPIALLLIAALCFVIDRQFSGWQKRQTRAWAKTGLVLLRICVWLAIVSALLSALLKFVMSQKEASEQAALHGAQPQVKGRASGGDSQSELFRDM